MKVQGGKGVRSSCSTVSMAVAAFLLIVPCTSRATNLWWDADGVAPLGGAGTWNTTSADWSTNSTGSGYQAWVNAAGNDAIFTNTGGTVTLSVPITANSITVQSANYTFSDSSAANALTLVGTGVFDTGANNATMSGWVAGSVGLTKLGSGMLNWNSGVSIYTGATTISNGSIFASAGGVFVGSNSLFVASSGRFVLGADQTFTGLGGNGLVTPTNTSSRTLILNGANDASFAGTLADFSPSFVLQLTKQGVYTQTLSGASSYSGVTTMNGGMLRVTSTNGLGRSSVTFATAGTILDLRNDGSGNNGTITYGNDITINAAATINVDNNGGGTTGNTIELGKWNASPALLTVTGASGYKLRFTNTINLASGGQGLSNTTTDVEWTGPLTGTVAANKKGTGTLIISGTANSTYSGTLTVDQ